MKGLEISEDFLFVFLFSIELPNKLIYLFPMQGEKADSLY
jgi:hypothetical protein